MKGRRYREKGRLKLVSALGICMIFMTMFMESVRATVVCSPGYYESSTDVCSICDAGYKCATQSNREACPAGTHAPRGSQACGPCPDGHSCSNSASDPVRCALGKRPSTDRTSCETCAAGTACPGPDESAQTCPNGFVSTSSGAIQCLPCPAGKSCSPTQGASSATTCGAGEYSVFGSATCSSVGVGYFSK